MVKNKLIFETSKWYVKSTCNNCITIISLDGKQQFNLGIKNNYVMIFSVTGDIAKYNKIFPGDYLVKIGKRNTFCKTLDYCCAKLFAKDEIHLEFERVNKMHLPSCRKNNFERVKRREIVMQQKRKINAKKTLNFIKNSTKARKPEKVGCNSFIKMIAKNVLIKRLVNN